ncbi:hypothetical protein O3P69_016025 [Scylla paramamosain]|uniref:Neurotransmitter-gated ion-channel ligand-binding domain-containing protein n=1 Tax=Scylla paramamosain TaxID=85552 RepID=A0AAW0TB27_SCYPA
MGWRRVGGDSETGHTFVLPLPEVMMGVAAALLFLLFHTTLLHPASAETEVEELWKDTVFTLKPEETHDAIAQVTTVFDRKGLSSSFTVCVWLWPLFTTTINILFTVHDADTSIAVKAIDEIINVVIYPRCPQAFPDLHLTHNTWQHLCLVADGSNILLHLGNKTNSQMMTMSDCSIDKTPTDSVTVVVGSDSGKFTYSGEATGVRYYDRQLTTSEVQSLQNCENSVQNYVQMKEVFITGNVSTYALGGQDKLCLPEDKEFMVLFTICSDHPTAKSQCTRLGGRLIGKDDDFDKIAKEAALSLDVQDDLFLWTDMADKEQGSVLSVNRDTISHHMLNYTSDTVLHTTACMMSLKKTVYMKGYHTETMTLLRYDRRLVLLSESGEIIRREPCPGSTEHEGFSRCLAKRSFGMQEEFASLGYGEDIFGRHNWNEENTNRYRNLSISFCEKDKFTCNDGSCIPLQERCDGTRHCEDNSDEGELCTLIRPRPPSYLMAYCPNPQPIIGLRIKVIKVNSVLLDANEFKITLHIGLMWRDERLAFQNLLKEPKILESHEYKDIWTPQLFFINANHEDNVAVTTKTSVLNEFTVVVKGKGQPEIYDSYEEVLDEGASQRHIWVQASLGHKSGQSDGDEQGLYTLHVQHLQSTV